MRGKYDAGMKAKAIRLVLEHRADYPTKYAAITTVAGCLGMTPETLRQWIRQDEADSGKAASVCQPSYETAHQAFGVTGWRVSWFIP